MDRLIGTLQGLGQLSGSISGQGGAGGQLSQPNVTPLDPYVGEYTVTPSDVPIVLDTEGMRMLASVTVEAIPSNYGKITWNGMTLSVI